MVFAVLLNAKRSLYDLPSRSYNFGALAPKWRIFAMFHHLTKIGLGGFRLRMVKSTRSNRSLCCINRLQGADLN